MTVSTDGAIGDLTTAISNGAVKYSLHTLLIYFIL